jgi:hypothetical protein
MFRFALWACLIVPVVGPTAAGAEIWFKVEYYEWEARPIIAERENQRKTLIISDSVPAEAKLVVSMVASVEGRDLMRTHMSFPMKLGKRWVMAGGYSATQAPGAKAKVVASAWAVTVTKERPKDLDDDSDK